MNVNVIVHIYCVAQTLISRYKLAYIIYLKFRNHMTKLIKYTVEQIVFLNLVLLILLNHVQSNKQYMSLRTGNQYDARNAMNLTCLGYGVSNLLELQCSSSLQTSNGLKVFA